MNITLILLIAIIILLLLILFISAFRKNPKSNDDFRNSLNSVNTELLRIDPLIRAELSLSRDEIQKRSKETREELSNSFKVLGDTLTRSVLDLSAIQKTQLDTFSERLQSLTTRLDEKMEKLIQSNELKFKELQDEYANTNKDAREELIKSLKENEGKTDSLILNFNENTKKLNDQLANSAKEN
jgi:hypothetical protein